MRVYRRNDGSEEQGGSGNGGRFRTREGVLQGALQTGLQGMWIQGLVIEV